MSLAQRYWNFDWDEPTNAEAYGRLAGPNGVGANLHVRIFSDAERDLQPGLAWTKRLLDHRALFADEPTFAHRPSTLEAIAHWTAARVATEFASITAVEIHDEPNLSCRAPTFACDRLEVRERIGNLTVTRACAFDPATGLGLARDGAVERAVRAIAPRFAHPHPGSRAAWAHDLGAALTAELPETIDLSIDLGELKTLRVKRAGQGAEHVV